MQLTEETLRERTDEATWARGVAYHNQGRVQNIVCDGDMVVATVEGQAPYRVRLTQLADQLLASCSCPIGRRGAFCKHCVAVGLALLAGDAAASSDKQRKAMTALDRYDRDAEQIRQHLAGKDRSTLVDLIVEQAMEDDRLLKRLKIEAMTGAAQIDCKAMRSEITAATRTRGFVDYRHAGYFATGIEQVVNGLATLLQRGFAKDVIPLVEYALRRVERAIERMDDSDGYMSPIFNDLQTLHHAACVEAKPDPVKLARRIFEWEVTGEWDVFLGAAQTYADVFGDVGLAEYRRLAETAWEQVSFLGPGDDRRPYDSGRFRITLIMEALVRQSGDLDARIDVNRRDLSSAHQFLLIAELCKEAGRAEQSLDWAERGLAAFPKHTDSRLLAFLADAYEAAGRGEDALRMIWQEFADRPSDLEAYQHLKAKAERMGNWVTWREHAMERLRADRHGGRDSRQHSEWRAGPVGGHSSLVDVYLWEGDAGAAWEEACTVGCSINQWLALARCREFGHPADAICIYQDYVAGLVSQTNNAAYAEAAESVRTIRGLQHDAGQEEAFADYLTELRKQFKAKRNFMKLLDKL